MRQEYQRQILNMYAGPILRYKASRRFMGIFKSSCTNASKMVSPALNTLPRYIFSQRGLKNLKILWFFLDFSSPFAWSIQNPPMVTSLAAVTNLPTVISLFSATSSCSSRNPHVCLMRDGALSLVLSVAFSSLLCEAITHRL